MVDAYLTELKAIRNEVLGDAEHDSGSQAEKRAEQEWVNPDHLMRGRLLVLRNEADVIASSIRALLREFPLAESTERATTNIRCIESTFGQVRDFLRYVREEFQKGEK
jgi:hypothetical protein